jgi:predicted phosphodiesterase
MKIAVISDIHGNMEALKQVLADIDAMGVRQVYSLGDNIGYGPEPLAVIQCIRERGISSVLGNHEWAAIDQQHLKWFHARARESLIMNVAMLGEAAMDYLNTLEKSMTAANCRFVHGFPPDSITLYLFQIKDSRIRTVLSELPEEICFVGHTHKMRLVEFDGGELYRRPLQKGGIRLEKGHKFIVNVGSVGQPRDSNNNAKYVLWDSNTRILEARYVPYNIAATVKGIEAAGLPIANATRLW